MKKILILLLLLPMIQSCTNTKQLNKEEKAVLKTLETMFDAMQKKDVKKSEEVLIGTGQYHNFNVNNQEVSVGTFKDYIAGLDNPNRTMSEHLIEPAEVTVIGNVATVISRYKFFVNEEISHTGDEVFTFLKKDEKWIITGSTYTVEK